VLLAFNRPDARNAMTFEMYEALHDTCANLDADPGVRVLVLKGAGDRAFASGTDIRPFLDFKTREDALGYEPRLTRVLARPGRHEHSNGANRTGRAAESRESSKVVQGDTGRRELRLLEGRTLENLVELAGAAGDESQAPSWLAGVPKSRLGPRPVSPPDTTSRRTSI